MLRPLFFNCDSFLLVVTGHSLQLHNAHVFDHRLLKSGSTLA